MNFTDALPERLTATVFILFVKINSLSPLLFAAFPSLAGKGRFFQK
jgi:hypothetical protein